MNSSKPARVVAFGSSVRGPAHALCGEPNQDAWSRASICGGQIVVVSDGVGSRPFAELGAKAACGAAVEALRAWLRHPGAHPNVLCGLIHLLWRARLPGDMKPEDAAATCLLAYVPSQGPGIAAQLGDGLILLDRGQGASPLVERAHDSFCNETLALGLSRSLSAWRTERLSDGPVHAALCTDGVSDDLLPDQLGAFMGWLREQIQPLSPARRWRALASELRGWPTPGHADDKTLCVLSRST